ncbi:MAG: aminopeptidase [Pseudomonadota bacterium]
MKRLLALLCVLMFLPACVGFYGQAIRGQWELIRKPKPIEQWLEAPSTDAQLRQNLEVASDARQFAIRTLGLPDNNSYTRYADLERPFVVWSVVATPPYSLLPESWCFPVAGCVNYRGYFAEQNARKFAKKLEAKGLDVSVGGVPAYSTLGRLKDPILNTMFRYGTTGAISTIFHELAHQKLYVKGDTPFNEAFATAVEEEGMRLWFARPGQDTENHRRYLENRKRRLGFIRIVIDSQSRLRALYAQDFDDETKEVMKQKEFARLKQQYAKLNEQWQGRAGYDNWFNRPLNNAHIASVANYEGLLPAFRTILRQESNDLDRFYQRCQELAKMEKSERSEAMRALMALSESDPLTSGSTPIN